MVGTFFFVVFGLGTRGLEKGCAEEVERAAGEEEGRGFVGLVCVVA